MNAITKRGWLFLLLAALAGIAMLFAACGGDDDDGGDATATATSTADEGDDGDDSGDDETATPSDEGDDDDDVSADDPFADLLNLTDELETVSGRVTYESTDTDSGDDITTTMTLYSDPENNRSRFDSVDENGASVTIITTTEASYTCSAEAGGEGACFEGEGSDDSAGLGLLGFFASPALLAAYVEGLDGIDIDNSSEEIAGIDADCFAWDGEIEGESGSGKICFGENGIMLSADFESDDGTSTHMRATDVSDEVSDDDFEPPYPPLEIPGQ